MRLPEVRIVANTKSPESGLRGGVGEDTEREFVNKAARVEARLEEAKVAEFLRS